MSKKRALKFSSFKNSVKSIAKIIDDNKNFFFYFSPDPDAVGSSIAVALYLNSLMKKSCLYLPEGFDPNLNFLFKIAEYNNIDVIMELDDVIEYLNTDEYVFISIDTATKYLLPNFDEINEIRKKYSNTECIEIDHHFGGDSSKIYDNSRTMFYDANSCCEIIGKFFFELGRVEKKRQNKKKIDYDLYYPRNIVLSLLVGICFDTQFGKFVVDKGSYDHWMSFLSERLIELTWPNNSYIRTAEEVFESINNMSQVKEETLLKYAKKSRIENGVGLLLMMGIGKYESLAENGDSTCIFSKVVGDLSNLIPEEAGKVGVLSFYDEFKDIYYIKVRRSFEYNDYDLRELEHILRELFGDDYLGGGGHPGATSFRLRNVGEEVFKERLENLYQRLLDIVSTPLS